jgi:hypothetical protein
MKKKLLDYVAQKVVELGVRHVFMVTGGGAMHLNHSLGVASGPRVIIIHYSVSIFQTHQNLFNGLEIGAGSKSSVNFPDFEKISAAFALPYQRCSTHNQMQRYLHKF